MPLIRYQKRAFKPRTLARIEKANTIIAEYLLQGFTLTLRQLYYQFVARDLIPNTERSYKALGKTISDARLAGLLDWDSIEDRTRELEVEPHWTGPANAIDAIAEQFRRDVWKTQPRRVEVWIEKEALAGVVSGICEELDVPYFACRGYVSQSEQWRAGRRFRERARQKTLVLHFGDHDPSGIDMTRDNRDRLELFAHAIRGDTGGGPLLELRRLALNRDQIDEYGPPPNPAKVTDSRFESYRVEHGDESWELDALEPAVLVDLIRREVEAEIEPDAWAAALERQREERELLERCRDRWEAVSALLEEE